jgi:hypothetical protein
MPAAVRSRIWWSPPPRADSEPSTEPDSEPDTARQQDRRGRPLTLLGPLLALLSAASWGAGDFCGGIATRVTNAFTAVLVGQVVGGLLAVVLLVASGESPPPAAAIAWAACGGAIGLGGLACLYAALARGTMGLVAPLTALIAGRRRRQRGWARCQGPVVPGMTVALGAMVLSCPSATGGEAGHFRGRPASCLSSVRYRFAGFFWGSMPRTRRGDVCGLFAVRLAGLTSCCCQLAGRHGRLPAHSCGAGRCPSPRWLPWGALGNLFS